MTSVPDIPTSRSAGAGALSDDLRSDVYDIISDAVQWQLPEEDWPKVEALVDTLREALRFGDPDAVESALAELELAAPLRITPIGGPPTGPAPARLRHVAERIVHDLDEGLDPIVPPAGSVDEESGEGDGIADR